MCFSNDTETVSGRETERCCKSFARDLRRDVDADKTVLENKEGRQRNFRQN